jgi:hypothetical protein
MPVRTAVANDPDWLTGLIRWLYLLLAVLYCLQCQIPNSMQALTHAMLRPLTFAIQLFAV